MVKTSPSNTEDADLIPSWGANSTMPQGQKPKTCFKQYCNKFNQDFKNGPHQKNLKKKKKWKTYICKCH